MSTTFTQPIRIFKRNNPTNDGTMSPDNTGAAVVAQDRPVVGGVASTMYIPAGAIIHNVKAYVSTAAGTPGTPNVTLNGTVIGTLSDAAGINTITFDAAQAALLANIGTSDKPLAFTAGAGAVGTILVTYTARNYDGTITAQGAGLSNN